MVWPVVVALLVSVQTVDHMADGMKALEANKYEEAAQLFLKAVEAEPKDYGAQFYLALAYSLLGKDAEAIPVYRKVLELQPGLYEAELNLGIVLLREKHPTEAIPYLKAAAEKKPKEFRPVFHLATAAFRSGDYVKAEEAYRAACELEPKSGDAEVGLGRALVQQGRIAEGIEHINKASALDPALRHALLEAAQRYELQKQNAEAIAIYEQFPENIGARERVGMLYLATGRPAEALTHLEFAVGKSPTSANRVALGQAYLRAGKKDMALPVVTQALAEDPNNTDLRMMHGRVLRDLTRYPEAAEEFYAVTRATPNSAIAWSELAGVLMLMENYQQALAALDKVRALGAENAGHFFFRAIILDKGHLLEPALENYQKFLSLSDGKHPDEEFKARQRVRIIKRQLEKR